MFASKDTLLTRPSGYNLNRSVRLRSSASAYLNRTPASATNQKTWTWSGWVKRGTLGSTQMFFSANTNAGTDTDHTDLRFSSTDTITFANDAASVLTAALVTTQVFRDPSAWYHIIFAVDTTQATASNRIKLYVNGVQVTAFGTATYPAQNASLFINNNINHRLGSYQPTSSYFDGYLTEVNFIDGQALTPSSFGETDAVTGVWKPKKYAGTYGTNGFYLNFSDNSAATAAAIGKDYSGNGNNWTPNNISVTSGVTYDSMTDVPTLTSLTAANYCVLNPLNKSSSSTVSNGNLRQTSSGGWYRAYSTIFFASTAVFYAEATMTALNSGANGVRVGIANANSVFTYLGSDANSWSYDNQGPKYNNGTLASYGASYAQGDVIGILFNNGSLTFYKNGTSQGVAYSGLTGTFCFAGSPFDTDIVDWNFGQRPFSNLPSGALALNTYNLPASTITNGAAYMAATLYTGNLTGQSITNTVSGASFQPDLVWVKSRSAATDNKLTDSVRGATKALISNTTGAETTDLTGVTAINSNGFTVGASTVYNNTGVTYVGWQWQAGQGSSSSNTNGSITSTVSVNATAGFSIVTYTGTGANATVGHGLGVAPKMVIVKRRSGTALGWRVYTSMTGATQYLELNSTLAATTSSTEWNDTSPTSTVFTLGTNGRVNSSGDTFVAYCWSEVAGFSKFGSYTGNGSTDGPFVYLGFRPKFVMFKLSSGANNWLIMDSSRNTYNVVDLYLAPNLSDAEASYSVVDFLSNGFKIRNTSTGWNGSGSTYIFAAFAENPFRNALAR